MCYWKSTSTMRFHSARWFCEDDGGELAFIKSADTNSFLLAENMIEYVCNSMPYLLWCFSYVPRYILTTMMWLTAILLSLLQLHHDFLGRTLAGFGWAWCVWARIGGCGRIANGSMSMLTIIALIPVQAPLVRTCRSLVSAVSFWWVPCWQNVSNVITYLSDRSLCVHLNGRRLGEHWRKWQQKCRSLPEMWAYCSASSQNILFL